MWCMNLVFKMNTGQWPGHGHTQYQSIHPDFLQIIVKNMPWHHRTEGVEQGNWIISYKNLPSTNLPPLDEAIFVYTKWRKTFWVRRTCCALAVTADTVARAVEWGDGGVGIVLDGFCVGTHCRTGRCRENREREKKQENGELIITFTYYLT